MADQRRVTLMSSDNKVFEVDEAVAFQSETVKDLVEVVGDDAVVPLPNVSSEILALVVEYCKYHVETDKRKTEDKTENKTEDKTENKTEDKPDTPAEDKAEDSKDVEEWDKEFGTTMDVPILLSLTLAANYLNIKSLLDFTCKAVADLISVRTPEEIRELFNIENDFTPEEEEAIRKENQWAFT